MANPETTEQPEASPLQNENEPVEKEKPQPLRSLLDDLPSYPSYGSFLPPPPTPPLIVTEKRLHINNIPFKWCNDDLIRLFSVYGETKHEVVVTNDRGSKGFGFVTFVDAAAADRAMSDIDGVVIDGRTIKVNEATQLRKCWDPVRVNDRHRPRNNDQRRGQCSSPELELLLMQQKQLLAQQQLQQYLAAKQQSDLIAMVLGLPTSNLGGVLAGGEQLPYSSLAGMPAGVLPGITIDPLAIQHQLLQSLSLLQPQQQLQSLPLLQQQLLQQPGAVPAFHSAPLHGQISTVHAGYPTTQVFPVEGAKTELCGQFMNAPPYHLLANEMGGSSSAFRSTSLKNDVSSQRYNPY